MIYFDMSDNSHMNIYRIIRNGYGISGADTSVFLLVVNSADNTGLRYVRFPGQKRHYLCSNYTYSHYQ